MSTKIEWVRNPDGSRGNTWNPLRARDTSTGKVGWHCELVSPGCQHCYAQTMNGRKLPGGGTGLPYTRSSRDKVETKLHEETLLAPLRWKKPRMVFVCSMTDLCGDWVTDEQIARVFSLMWDCHWHTFQVLTKRAERMREFLSKPHVRELIGAAAHALAVQRNAQYGQLCTNTDTIAEVYRSWPLPNVWLGVSVENQDYADERIPLLCQTPAAVRFLSCEPLLGPLDLPVGDEVEEAERREMGLSGAGMGRGAAIDWVIVGCESNGRRVGSLGEFASEGEWWDGCRSLVYQCQDAGVPCFLKQTPINGRVSHDPSEWPAWARVREFPEVAPAADY